MNVSLTKELEEFVRRKVESGRYRSATEVIRAGFRLLEQEDDIWDYVAERFGYGLADDVLESLHRAFRLLAGNPGIGRIREDIAPHASFVPARRAVACRASSGRSSGANRSR